MFSFYFTSSPTRQTPHAFIYSSKIIKNRLKSFISISHSYTHQNRKANRPDHFPAIFSDRTDPPHTHNKKAITKAISIFSTQTLHHSIKLNQAKPQPKSDANRTLASKCARKDTIITTDIGMPF